MTMVHPAAGAFFPRGRSTDEPLLSRLRSGESPAFAEAVRRHAPFLLKIAFGVLRDPASAEDVVQDAWLCALRGISRFDGRCTLRTWLVHIVLNRARSRLSRERICIPLSSLPGLRVPPYVDRGSADAGDDGAFDPSWPSDHRTPERVALEREAAHRLWQAFRSLPGTQQRVILLRDFAGLNSAQTCRALCISDLAQRIRLCRARATLRGALAQAVG